MLGDNANRRTVLIVAASRWPHTAFFAGRLIEKGFSVVALCPRKGPLRHTSGIRQFYTYQSFRAAHCLRNAIRRCLPVLLIPGDDEAAYAMYQLYARCRAREDAASQEIARLIEYSLGHGASFTTAQSKLAIVRFARECGIRVPETWEIASVEDLARFAMTADFPFLLKQDETNGGRGVMIVTSADAAPSAYRSLKMRRRVDAIRDLCLRLDLLPIVKGIAHPPPRIAAQTYIRGRPANRAVACWNGKVLGGITVQAVETYPDGFGAATVLEAIENREIDHAVETLALKLGLSGFCGFDFVLDDTGRAYLLELNPRLTPQSWIGTTPETDLCAAIFEAMTGTIPIRTELTPKWPPFGAVGQRLALFPFEWMRCKSSEHLFSGYHRVPWYDPQLVEYLITNTLRAEERTRRSPVFRTFERVMSRMERAGSQRPGHSLP